MDIDLNLFKTFYTVANIGNITKASQVLYVSQPAVTKSIKALEKELGGKLFIRTKKGVELTEEGKVFYKYAKEIMENVTNAKNKFSSITNLEEGKIRIGASSTISKHFLMPYIKEFHKEYPNIDIQITNELTSNLLKDLRNGYLDFLVLNMPADMGSDIILEKCYDLHDSFACSSEYLLNPKKKLSLEELLSYKIITQKEPSVTRSFLNSFMKSQNVIFKPSIEIVSFGLVVEFIKSGFGIGYVTKEFIQKELETGELYEIIIDKKIPDRGIGIATLKNNVLNFASSKFINTIKERYI